MMIDPGFLFAIICAPTSRAKRNVPLTLTYSQLPFSPNTIIPHPHPTTPAQTTYIHHPLKPLQRIPLHIKILHHPSGSYKDIHPPAKILRYLPHRLLDLVFLRYITRIRFQLQDGARSSGFREVCSDFGAYFGEGRFAVGGGEVDAGDVGPGEGKGSDELFAEAASAAGGGGLVGRFSAGDEGKKGYPVTVTGRELDHNQ